MARKRSTSLPPEGDMEDLTHVTIEPENPLPETPLVRFLQGWRSYNAGETAGFSAIEAEFLVNRGIAERVEP